MSDLIASLTDVIRLVGPRPYQPADLVREHLARGVGQAPGCLVRRGMWGFVPHLPLHRWSSVLQLTTLPSSAAARASFFLPKARQWATWTGRGNEEHGVLGSIPVILVFTIRVIPS